MMRKKGKTVAATAESKRSLFKPYVWITIGIAGLTFLFQALDLIFDDVNIALIYLFPILFSAVYGESRLSYYAASASVLAFDYFFVPPFLSFTVQDLRYVLSFAVYLAVAALTATLAARLRQQVKLSKQREANTAALYALSRQMTAIGDIQVLLDNIVARVYETVQTYVAIYLPDDKTELRRAAWAPAELRLRRKRIRDGDRDAGVPARGNDRQRYAHAEGLLGVVRASAHRRADLRRDGHSHGYRG